MNVQAMNLINLSLGNAIDTETPVRLQKQINDSQKARKAKGTDWFTASLAGQRQKNSFPSQMSPSQIPSASAPFVSPQSLKQAPIELVNSVALIPNYKDPGIPDFDEMKRKTLVDAMRRVDRTVTLNPLDRQRVKDAVARNIWLGEIDPHVLDRIVGYAQGGSSKIARLAGAGAYGANVDHHSLASLMLELDGKFNGNKGYWQNRNAVKNALAGRLNAAGMSSDETYRLALKALGRTNELARMDTLQGQARYNAAHRAELDSTNPNRVGDDSEAYRSARNEHGETLQEYGQRRFAEKARSGANPITKAAHQANLDWLDLFPHLVHRLPIISYLAGTAFSQTPEQYAAVAAKLNNSPELDKLTERLPMVGNIAQGTTMTSDAVKWAEGLWDGGSKEGYRLSGKPSGPYDSGEQALHAINTALDYRDWLSGGLGLLKKAKARASILNIDDPDVTKSPSETNRSKSSNQSIKKSTALPYKSLDDRARDLPNMFGTPSEMARAALNDNSVDTIHRITKIQKSIADRLREEFGISENLINAPVNLEAGRVRHIRKKHGNETGGQITIIPSDYDLLESVINNPDHIEWEKDKHGQPLFLKGKPAITFSKFFPDGPNKGRLFAATGVLGVSNDHSIGGLRINTVYKHKIKF